MSDAGAPCRPEISAHLTGIYGQRNGYGKWAYATRCTEHGASWTTKEGATWLDAMELAEDHHREYDRYAAEDFYRRVLAPALTHLPPGSSQGDWVERVIEDQPMMRMVRART